MPRLRLIRSKPKYQLKCKPSLRHLYIFLFLSSTFIVFCLYVLNEKVDKSRASSSMANDEFQSDFLILPKTLPVAARLLTVLIFLPYANLQSRLTIRNSWASHMQQYNASVFFVLSVPDRSASGSQQHPVSDEANFFNDIIQINAEEQRAIGDGRAFDWTKPLTLALRFVEANIATGFVLKVGSDTFVNLHKITDYLSEKSVDSHKSVTSHGYFATSTRDFLFSDQSSRYFGDKNSFDVASSAFVFSFDVLQTLLQCLAKAASTTTNFVATSTFTESQFLVDCLHNANILMRNVNKFLLNSYHVSHCMMHKNFLVHPVSDVEMSNYWNSLKRNELVC